MRRVWISKTAFLLVSGQITQNQIEDFCNEIPDQLITKNISLDSFEMSNKLTREHYQKRRVGKGERKRNKSNFKKHF